MTPAADMSFGVARTEELGGRQLCFADSKTIAHVAFFVRKNFTVSPIQHEEVPTPYRVTLL